jgi:hypothetical protein
MHFLRNNRNHTTTSKVKINDYRGTQGRDDERYTNGKRKQRHNMAMQIQELQQSISDVIIVITVAISSGRSITITWYHITTSHV